LGSPRLTAVAIAVVFLIDLVLPHLCFATSYMYSYWLLDHPDGSNRYRLTVSVTSSLYEYYRSKDHDLYSLDFARFVTPYALMPIAESIWSIYSNEEDFANGVLMLVHQIPYEESAPQKYPVEVIVENKGDCDLLSFVAASIMIAGGLDVVLLYYENQKHMNVGVYLSSVPEDVRTTIYYINHENKRYYIAECTGGNWENGWRVGECPEELKEARVQVITLENVEQWAPEQVSSSYSSLAPSSVSLTLSASLIIEGTTVIISGTISPVSPNKVVTIYVRPSGSPWNVLQTVTIDSNGKFSYMWTPRSAGTYYIWASWPGDMEHAGADSNIQVLRVIPLSWILIAIIATVLAGLIAILIATSKKEKLEEPFSEEDVNLQVAKNKQWNTF